MFERQMRYLLEHGYKSLTPPQFLEALDDPEAASEKSVFITFDDGYLDFYENAFPVLAELSMTATVFVITGVAGGKTGLWSGPAPHGILPLLSWPQIEEMTRAGISFESHSHTHAEMSKLSPAEMAEEAGKSKRILEERLGTPVRLFAYPYGDFNEAAKKAVAETGYEAGLAWASRGLDRFELRRRSVPPARTLIPFPLRLSPAYYAFRSVGRILPVHRWVRPSSAE